MAINAYIKIEVRSQVSNLILHLMELGKEEQTKPMAAAMGAWLGWRGGNAPVDEVRGMRS